MAQKQVKNVYLPAGLLVSMYNLYGGNGTGEQIINMYDVEYLCSFLEFYFNYTDPSSKEYIYRFYTLPYFHVSNTTRQYDESLFIRDRALMDKYASKVADLEKTQQGPLYLAAEESRQEKKALMLGVKDSPRFYELDPSFSRESGLPTSAYACGLFMDDQFFRVGQLYATGKFKDGLNIDFSTFFLLSANNSRKVLSEKDYKALDGEIRQFLQDYFLSDSYKMLSPNDKTAYAPNIETFMKCFLQATQAFNRLGCSNVNNKFTDLVHEALDDKVIIEIV